MAPLLNRRDFLAYGGAALAGITLGEAGRRVLARADERTAVWRAPAVETWAVSVCRECPAGCGVRVRLMDGVPVKLEGNPLCPIARGRLCAKGQAALESYFDPDRLVGPARRKGPRGANQWTPISWDEAIGEFASRLGRAGTAGGGILAVGMSERGPTDGVWAGFWTALHAQAAWTLPPTAERLAPRFAALTGASGDPVFDLEHATHVLSFGAPIVEDWLSPVWAQRSYGRFRRGAGRPRGRLVHVDGRRSMTARKADEWLPVLPDHQASLAYGIASVLLREGRVDRTELTALGGNVGEFEREVIARYTPDNVAAVSGIPVVTLLRLARDLVATPQPIVVVAADAAPELVDAVLALNALVGALDRPGGVFEAPNGDGANRDRRDAVVAIDALRGASTPPSVVVLRDASPLRSLATPLDIAGDLERCGFLVSLSPYLDETTAVADLLLPIHTPLESWHALAPPANDGMQTLACAEPAAAARLDTRDLVEVLHLTAQQLGDGAASAGAFASSADVVRAELAQVWGFRRGVPYTTPFETNWTLQLERGGWWVPPAPSSEEFARTVLAAGGWVDPYFKPGQLRGSLARRGGLTFVPPAAPVVLARSEHASGPRVVLASAERAPDGTGEPGDWPLQLLAFTPAAVNVAGSLNQPALFELLGQPDSSPWQAWAELNPDTAREFGIRHGAAMRISSGAGSIDVVAIVVDRAPQGIVAVSFVPAPGTGGRWARLMSADARRLWGRRAHTEHVGVRVTAL